MQSGNQVSTQLLTTAMVLLAAQHLPMEALQQVVHIQYQQTVLGTLLKQAFLLQVGVLLQMVEELHMQMLQQL